MSLIQNQNIELYKEKENAKNELEEIIVKKYKQQLYSLKDQNSVILKENE